MVIMNISDLHSYIGIILTIGGFFYVFAKFKAEFELHKKILNELFVKVESINNDLTFMKGYMFGKKS